MIANNNVSLLDAPRRKKCFPSMAKVNVENGESVTMSELQIGDKVKTGTNMFTLDLQVADIIRNRFVSLNK